MAIFYLILLGVNILCLFTAEMKILSSIAILCCVLGLLMEYARKDSDED